MADGPFVCPVCDTKSWHPDDIEQGYCGVCHAFTRRCTIWSCQATPAVILGNIAACADHGAELTRSTTR